MSIQIDNVKMWESLIRISKEGDNLIGDREIGLALKDQGLEYKDGEIVSKEEIKGNQREVSPNSSELTEFEKAIALLIFNSQNTCNSIKVCEEHARKESKALLTFARQQIASEQPMAWSEEDEEIRNALIEYLGGSDALSVDLALAISWLKSLKDRCCHQNGDYHEGFKKGFAKAKATNCHWKPSEEQIAALDAVTIREITFIEKGKLKELLKQLKAL